MKKIFPLLFIAFHSSAQVFACTVCRSQQPEAFEEITHGVGPEGYSDYIVVVIACGVVLITLVMSIRYLIQPKETNADHIKNLILENSEYETRQ